MQKVQRILGVAAGLLVPTAAAPLVAQQQQTQPGTMVFSYNKCHNLGELNAALDSVMAPVLDSLVRERRLMGWGVVTHAWGDEWNWNIYYFSRDHAVFLTAWDEFVRRVTARAPGLFSRFSDWCTEHRDNIYRVRQARGSW